MKQLIPVLLLLFSFVAQAQDEAANEIAANREKLNQKFLDPKTSPLDPADKKKFAGLNYFSNDPDYRIPAKFVRTEKPAIFKLKMTASAKVEYTTVGYVTFELQGVEYKLTAYRQPESEDQLFIPFTDASNGKDTYESGRYVGFPAPAGDQLMLDFNGAYNPYCAYSKRFSCPIPPPENKIAAAIKAGEKKFH